MKSPLPLLLLPLIAAWLSVVPVGAQETATPGQSAPAAIAVGEDAVSDAEISNRISTILAAVPDFGGVSFSVTGGVVSLTGSVPETAEAARIESIVSRVDGVVTVENSMVASSVVSERLTPGINRIEERLRHILALLPLLAIAVVVFLVIAGIGWVITGRLGLFDRIAPNAFIADIFRQILRIAFIFGGVVVALDLLGATALLGTLLGAAGIIGLAVGFGVRDTIENFVASVMLSVRQPFSPNDLVEIDGDQGHVIRLTSRATVLLSPEGNHVRIPNAIVFKSKIINFTREPQRRFEFELGVDAECDLSAAQATGLNAMQRLDFVLNDPEASAWIENVGDSSVQMRFTGWIDQRSTNFATARGEAIRITKAALEASGVTLPEPGYRLRIDREFRRAAPEVSRVPPAAAHAGLTTETASASAPRDDTIERKVDDERRADPDSDLLDPNAPTNG